MKMYSWCTVKILLPKKSLKLSLNRNLSFLSKQTVTKSGGGRFAPTTFCKQHPATATANLKHSQCTLLEHENLWRFLPDRSFSSTKTVLSSKGQNRDQENRQVLILVASLVALLLLVIYANLIMEYHQDYVVIEPDEKD